MPAPSPEAGTLHAGGSGGLITESSAEVALDAIREGDAEREVKKLGLGFWIAVGWLVLLITLAVLAPVLPFIEDPNVSNADALEAPPSAEHWFGGDDIGRDVFSRVIWGGRVSLFIGVAAVTFGFVIGGTMGLTAGFYGGRYERVVIGAMDIMLAFPALVLALALVTFLSEPGTQNATLGTVTLVLTILAVPALARITRAATLSFSQREFVTASRALGARNSRIIAREILPNVVPPDGRLRPHRHRHRHRGRGRAELPRPVGGLAHGHVGQPHRAGSSGPRRHALDLTLPVRGHVPHAAVVQLRG